MDNVRTLANTSSRPVRAVTDRRVPTTRHTALAAAASATPGCPITPVTPSADDEPQPGVPAASLASGTVATRARNTARSASSSTRALSRATCSPTMMVTGPFAQRNARTIGCGSPIGSRRLNFSRVASTVAVAVDVDLRLLNILGQQQYCWTAGACRGYSAGQRRQRCRRASSIRSAEDRHRRKQRLGIQ